MDVYCLYIITPILGLLRNYSKYKNISIKIFIRSPIIYGILLFYFKLSYNKINIYKILIYERWFFFIYKTMVSIYNNDYIKKKDKYIKKYNLNYALK